MKDILEPVYQRQIDILDYLLIHHNKASLNELASVVNASESTVLRDIHYFEQQFSQYMEMKRDNVKDIELINTSSQQIKHIQSTILNSSLNVRMIKHIFLTPFNTIDYYADLLNVSASSVRKNIKEVNSKLEEYQINIKRVSHKYFIFAESEQLLRELLSIFWVETHLFNFEDSISDYTDIIYELNHHVAQIFTTNKFLKNYYLAFIYVSIVREQGHFFLAEAPIIPKEDSREELLDRIKKSILYSPYTDNVFFINRKFYKLTDYLQRDLFNTDNLDAILPFFNIIRKIYENEISHQVPIQLFISQLTFFYHELENTPYIYSEVHSIILNIQQILHIDLTDYTPLLSYILVVYYPNIVRSHANKNEIIYVHSIFSTRHAQFLIHQLDSYFNYYYRFYPIDTPAIPSLKTKGLIITNDQKMVLNQRIIVDEYITHQKLKEIENQIIHYKNKESPSKLT